MRPLRIAPPALVLFLSLATAAAPELQTTAPAKPADKAAAAKSAKSAEPQTPQQHAAEVASHITIVKRALHEVRRAAAELKDLQLRAALEAQLQAPWLPPEAYAFAHPAETEKLLHDAGLLAADAHLVVPPLGQGSLASAPGGPCATGHHGYPGGLAVHEATNLAHARALAAVYKTAYGLELNDEWLVAGALWHDVMKAGTLPWDASGDCPHSEPKLAGTALHHPLGIAAALLRHLPVPLIWVIAAAHQPPTSEHLAEQCGWLRAAGIVAVGDEKAIPCPSLDEHAKRPPIEAFINNSADIDFPLTVSTWGWYAAQTPGGWERYAALEADGSDLVAWQRASARP